MKNYEWIAEEVLTYKEKHKELYRDLLAGGALIVVMVVGIFTLIIF